jgi:putative transposase
MVDQHFICNEVFNLPRPDRLGYMSRLPARGLLADQEDDFKLLADDLARQRGPVPGLSEHGQLVAKSWDALMPQAPAARSELAQAGRPGYMGYMIGAPEGRHMSHTYAQNHLHVVFSTKERKRLIAKPMQPKLWSYMAGIARNHGFLVIANSGMEDHAHLLIQLPPVLALSKAVELMKANSSKWMGERGFRFSWQEGYGAFSVSASSLTAVVRYIEDQERHHRKMTFEDEFIGLLEKHGVQFDLKYVFG